MDLHQWNITSYTEDILNYIANDQNVDASKIAPDIRAIADTVTTQEDTEIEINVLANDSYVKTSPFSLDIENPSNGTIETNNNIVTYTPDADYNGTDTFSYTLTQADKTATAEVSITIESVNDEPSIDIASTVQADENQTSVVTVSISDADGDDLTLTLGGTDADSFNLSSENVLSFKEAPDYETKSSYTITLSVSDGTITVTKDITISINNLNDNPPIFTSNSTLEIEENIKTIATITASDADGSPLVFSIEDDSEIMITSDGILSFITPADYETKTSYSTIIKVFDGIFSTSQTVTINVTDANDNPPVITSSDFTSDENQSSIGVIEATDVDTNTVLTYSISGTDAEYMTVDSESGILTFSNTPDYETKNIYTVNLDVSDGLNSTSKEVSVQINNILEDIISSTFTISDGTSSQVPILNVSLKLDELSKLKKFMLFWKHYRNKRYRLRRKWCCNAAS